jgi:hypothetical protein
MSTDLDKLLDDASSDPTVTIDPDTLWAQGRRRRWTRRAGATGGTALIVVAVTLVGLDLANPATPDIAPLDVSRPADEPSVDAGIVDDESLREEAIEAERLRIEELRARAEAERLAAEERAAELLAAEERAAEDAAAEKAAADAQEAEERAAAEEEAQDATVAAPSPDASAMANPCAAHEGRDMDAFVTVAGPVSGQQVGSSFELVGCSNVPEATVRYRLVGDGGVLVDSFTTAGCGTGCVGEYRETVTVPAGSGSLTLEVFWDSPKDGSEQDKVELQLARG